jgi:integrase
MPRHTRHYGLENRSARLKRAITPKPLFIKIGPGLSLGYRRNAASGSWVLRAADGRGGNWTQTLGRADDHDTADGLTVFDFWQAQDAARKLIRSGAGRDEDTSKLLTVKQAIDQYKIDLAARGGDTGPVMRVANDLPAKVSEKVVGLVLARDLRAWRDSLLKRGLAAASVNRLVSALKASLNHAADLDERIPSRRAWERGLLTLPDAVESRNVVVPEAGVRKIVECAYAEHERFGLYVEVLATTGARASQAARLDVDDLQDDRDDPRLMMPSSKKGRGKKKILRRPVPIPPSLAARLRQAAGQRLGHTPLLLKPEYTDRTKPAQDREAMARAVVEDGMSLIAVARKFNTRPMTVARWALHLRQKGAEGVRSRPVPRDDQRWRKSDHSRPFAKVVEAAGLDPTEVTVGALRHTHITRQLIAGTPTRVVAANCDTSVAMLEKTYSRYIADFSDAIARRALLDMAAQPVDNVIPLRG